MSKEKSNSPVWDKSHHSIFEDFALDLRDFTRTGRLPAYADSDVAYALELWRKRLKDKGLILKYDITPRGHFAEGGGMGRSWQDARYISTMEYRTCEISREFYKDKKREYSKKQDSIFYQIITNVLDGGLVRTEMYTCPNCGAISQINDLQNGCPYCHTFFEMSDLFPKVTNYYFIKDSGKTEKELKYSIARVVVPCMLFFMLIAFYHNPITNETMIFDIIGAVAAGVIGGGIIGYIIWAFSKMASLFIEAGKSIPMLVNTAGSGKRFVANMRRYSPEFSYEYFTNKVVSILKMLVYAEDAAKVPYYVGEPLGNMFSDIVDSSYSGAVALKHFQVQGEWCYVTVEVYMEDVYDNGKSMYTKNDRFRILLCKNISKPIDMHFSIKKIHCKGCNTSFDATKQKTCPSCGKTYEIDGDDWVVVKIEKR